MLGDAGVVVGEKDRNAWVNTLEHLLGNPAQRAALAVRGLDGVEVPAPVPVTFAMVFAMAVFADWLFPPGGQPSRDEIVGEITHCLREGIIHHDPND